MNLADEAAAVAKEITPQSYERLESLYIRAREAGDIDAQDRIKWYMEGLAVAALSGSALTEEEGE